MGRDNSANITDEAGRSLPAFGPIKIKEGKVNKGYAYILEKYI